MKTKRKMNGYILRSSAAALLLSCAFLALCSAINLPNYPPRISTPKNNTALGANGRQSASSVVAAPTTTCGNGVPCSCGDTVVADTTLSDQDPVTQTVCSGNGLVLASGIILDLNGYTISGSGAGTGIDIADGGTMRNGTVATFGIGVAVNGGTAAVMNIVTSTNVGQGIVLNNASALLVVSDFVAIGNNGGGVLISAGRADFAGATRINGNHGGSPVNYGVQVAPGAVLTLTGTVDVRIQINSNDGVGILNRGNFSTTTTEMESI